MDEQWADPDWSDIRGCAQETADREAYERRFAAIFPAATPDEIRDAQISFTRRLRPAPALKAAPPAAPAAEERSESTEDFVLGRLSRNHKGHDLEPFVAGLLRAMGFRARLTPKSGDGGVDIIAHRDDLGFEPPIIKVQVKSTRGQIGEPEVRQLRGALAAGEKGLLVTLGSFSAKARAFAQAVPDIRLVDGAGLVELIERHYEALESPLRAAVPLKRVWVADGVG
jgi:restriction system protein